MSITIERPMTIFDYPASRWQHISEQKKEAELLKAQSIRTSAAHQRFLDTTAVRVDRIIDRQKGIQDTFDEVHSSQIAAENYFRIQIETDEAGGSKDDAYRIFRICLAINLSVEKELMKRNSKIQPSIAETAELHKRSAKLWFNLSKTMTQTPSWFSGTNTEWQTFVILNSCFTRVLPDGTLGSSGSYCTPEGLPDWFDFKNNTAPDDQLVKDELEEDRQMEAVLRKNYSKTVTEGKFVVESVDSYKAKIADVKEVRKDKLVDFCSTIPGLLMYLEAQPYVFGTAVKPNYYEIPPEERNPVEENLMNIKIGQTAQLLATRPYGAFSPEMLTLWFSKTLIDADVVKDTREPLPPDFAHALVTVLEDPKKKYYEDPSLLAFKEQGKNRFSALFYRFRPFLGYLNQDEREHLAEWVRIYSSEPSHTFVKDLSDIISEKGTAIPIEHNPDKERQRAIDDLSKTVKKTISEDWYVLYKQLLKELGRYESNPEEFDYVAPVIQETTGAIDVGEPLTETEAALEEEIRKLDEGILTGWSIYHSSNPAINIPKYYTPVTGETLEERTEKLGDLLRTISRLPISEDMLIKQFENIVSSVDDVEEKTRGARVINGQRYRRRRKGNLRLFYQVDELEKKIVFFLHKKEAMDYQGDRKHF